MNFLFFFNSILMGIGLAMDAFSVSLANGLNEPCMRLRRVFLISGVFAVFQGIMPLTGWFLVHTAKEHFATFASLVPFIALLLLSFIGGKMLYDGIKHKDDPPCECAAVGFLGLIVQGIATSIDALSVGFTIADYGFVEAIVEVLIIIAVTFVICTLGVEIGRRAGTRISGKASILGGAILIFIGIEIFVSSFL